MSPRRIKVKQVFYLYRDQIATLKRIAERLDESISKLIRSAIDEFLQKHK
jgi:hypothetical protein